MTRVCVIGESDPFVAQLLQRFAEEGGLEGVRAQVGQDVMDIVRQARPSVILLDPELPGTVRGWEAAQMISCDPVMGAVPIVVCSWLSESDARALIGGAAGYLRKPELLYEAFVAALAQAQVEVGSPLEIREAGNSHDIKA